MAFVGGQLLPHSWQTQRLMIGSYSVNTCSPQCGHVASGVRVVVIGRCRLQRQQFEVEPFVESPLLRQERLDHLLLPLDDREQLGQQLADLRDREFLIGHGITAYCAAFGKASQPIIHSQRMRIMFVCHAEVGTAAAVTGSIGVESI